MVPDYDKALYYTLWGHWDDLVVVMARTKDDLLSKKIKDFLTQFHFSHDEQSIITAHDNLLYYIDHAMHALPASTIQL